MAERGQPIPEWLKEQPDVLSGDEFYIDAFWELSTCRHIGMAMGPIPWDKITQYAAYVALEADLIPVFVLTIRALDNAYLEWVESKREKNRPKTSGKPRKKARLR